MQRSGLRGGLAVLVRIDLINGTRLHINEISLPTGPAFFFNASGDGDMYKTAHGSEKADSGGIPLLPVPNLTALSSKSSGDVDVHDEETAHTSLLTGLGENNISLGHDETTQLSANNSDVAPVTCGVDCLSCSVMAEVDVFCTIEPVFFTSSISDVLSTGLFVLFCSFDCRDVFFSTTIFCY